MHIIDDHRTNYCRLRRFVIQSLPQFAYPQVTEPAQHQVTVNQKGRTERIHVNLEAVYPTPEIVGSELSLEELRAGQRGWLSKTWQPEISRKSASKSIPIFRDENEGSKVDEIIREVSDKLAIARDNVALDENGAKKEPREGRARKMKIKEVNETQISECFPTKYKSLLTVTSQSKIIFTLWTKDDQTQVERANNDTAHSCGH